VFPLGIDPYEQVPVTEAVLQPGDRILMYTDGITERFSMDGKTRPADDDQALLLGVVR
jgi:serine phosphatase RsbU (regulator of sigma subunit)